jgi:GTP-binding protein EngB required for normal cell division
VADAGGLRDQPELPRTREALAVVTDLIQRFSLADLRPLLNAVRDSLERPDLNLAIFGRFKAGKTSFLNSLLGRELLPVGVIPVTAAVTEIAFGETPRAEIVLPNGAGKAAIAFDAANAYISGRVPAQSHTEMVRLWLPEMARLRGLRLVDTPGLESVLRHNTESSFSWSPNVDLALVAVAADPPLLAQDLALIENLLRFTPRVSVLLTKMDTLDGAGQVEVAEFVEARLRERFPQPIPVFPFSIRPGYSHLRQRFQSEYLEKARADVRDQQDAILSQKLRTLLSSVSEYLRLAVAAAAVRSDQRRELAAALLDNPKEQADLLLQFQLIAAHARSITRSHIEQVVLAGAAASLGKKLGSEFRSVERQWLGGLAKLLPQFASWLRQSLLDELAALSLEHRSDFLLPVGDAQRRFSSELQRWRDQLSQKVQTLYGVQLRIAQTGIEAPSPPGADLSIGKIFDRNWELLSPLIPMSVFRPLVLHRFSERIDAEIHKNLSRLATQWEEISATAIRALRQQSEEQFAQLQETLRLLLAGNLPGDGQDAAAALRSIERLSSAS